MLMSGPPGSGKSMLAACLPSMFPPLDAADALAVSMIASIAGTLNGHLKRRRPFRDPDHKASMPALVGGGHKTQPGEISIAHRGVLFLDELPEYPARVLDSLRQPLETGRVDSVRPDVPPTTSRKSRGRHSTASTSAWNCRERGRSDASPPAEGSANVAVRVAEARAYHRTVKVARTIADLAGADGVGRLDVAETLNCSHPPQRA